MKNEKSKNETTITVNLPNDVLEGAKEVVEIVNNYLSANAYRDDLFGNLEERKLFDLGFVWFYISIYAGFEYERYLNKRKINPFRNGDRFSII